MFAKKFKYAFLGLVAVSSLSVASLGIAQERRGNIDECSEEILDDGDGAVYARRINKNYDYWYEKGEFEDDGAGPSMTRYQLEQLRWVIYGSESGGQETEVMQTCNDLARAIEDWKALDTFFKDLEVKMIEMETAAGLEYTGLYDYGVKQEDGPAMDGKGVPTYLDTATGEWLDPDYVDSMSMCDHAACTNDY
jgi:hypothetical protein